ncbi:MAG TPA: hypothetical protein PKH07_15380, partial [bacterium]|nr:hypothetical protein [bacterium]
LWVCPLECWSVQKPAARPKQAKPAVKSAPAPKLKQAVQTDDEQFLEQIKGRQTSVEEQLGVSAKDSRAQVVMRQNRAQMQLNMSEDQQQQFKRITDGFDTLYGSSNVTEEQRTQLCDEVKKTLCGFQEPSEQALDQFCLNLVATVIQGELSPNEATQIYQNVRFYVETQNVTQEHAEWVVNDSRHIANSSNCTPDHALKTVSCVQRVIETAWKAKKEAEKAAAEVEDATAQ